MKHCTEIPYYDGMKYVVATPDHRELQFKLRFRIENECISNQGELEILNCTDEDGSVHSWLCVTDGYPWDGCSGPTIDTKNSMRAGLVHDGLYQLMREGKIPRKHRIQIDNEFETILKEDGMSWFRRNIWETSVNWFAGFASKAKAIKKLMWAPHPPKQ